MFAGDYGKLFEQKFEKRLKFPVKFSAVRNNLKKNLKFSSVSVKVNSKKKISRKFFNFVGFLEFEVVKHHKITTNIIFNPIKSFTSSLRYLHIERI